MSKRSGFYPWPSADDAGQQVVSQAGGLLLTETVRVVGLGQELSAALAPWRLPTAVHDPAKVVCDLAVTLALGGDCLADIALLRAEPSVYGLVASDPTVSRTVDRLARDAPRALAAIHTARAAARARAWELAGEHAPDHAIDPGRPLVIDVDATLVTAHSEKQGAAPTFKRGFGHHPLWAFVDHGPDGTGEPLSVLLRPGNAGSNTAADHITVLRQALRQLRGHRAGTRPGRRVLIRADAAGATHELLDWITGQRLSYSVGFTLPDTIVAELAKVPEHDWQCAYDADGEPRPGAWVLEVTGLLNLSTWPKGMRVIVRRERPHPGAQLRITDADGHRLTAFATNTAPGGPHRQLADLELRHRRRARAEDRHPHREGHRPDQPAPARPGPEPDLVRARRAGLRDHHLGPAARPGRAPGAALGTQTTTATDLLHRRPAGPHRAAHRAAPGRARTLDPAAAHRDQQPARAGRPRLTARLPSRPALTDRPMEPAPTRATSGELSYPHARITRAAAQRPNPITDDHPAKDPG